MATETVAIVVGVGVLAFVGAAVTRAYRVRRHRPSTADLSVVLDQVPVPESDAAEIVRAWASGQHCVSCGCELTDGHHGRHHVALLDPSGITREWVDIGADRLTLALATSLPVCWNCHVSATFRRLHPELVTDRSWARPETRQDR